MANFPMLHARSVRLKPDGRSIDQSVAPGEIVGLAGLDGHGQEAFLLALGGIVGPAGGAVEVEGPSGTRRIAGFRSAVASGIAYLPRDRRANGIFPTLSILDNFAISSLRRDTRFGLIRKRARRGRYEAYREKLGIVAQRPEAPITTLSGGNQQKVLLARALALEPSILLLNDPTRGVDAATRQVLYGVFRDLAAGGMSLIVLSSEIEEILLLAGRVLVFREHELSAEIAGADMTADAVIAAMFGRAT